MAAPYGVRARWRKPVFALAIAVTAAVAPGKAAPVRLLILGDSLSAGYGLLYGDGFEAQLAAALRARGLDVRIVDGGERMVALVWIGASTGRAKVLYP